MLRPRAVTVPPVAVPPVAVEAGPPGPLDLAAELCCVTTLSGLVTSALPYLARGFRAELVLFGVAGTRTSGAAVYPRDEILIRTLESAAAPIWHDGPLTRWCREHPAWSPVRLSDVLSEEEWRQVPFYTETAQQVGATFILYVPVVPPGRPTVGGYFVTRRDRDFSRSEVDAAAGLQPVLVASHGPLLVDLDRPDALSDREQQVLELTAAGLTAHAISSRLGISIHTVRKHLHNAYRRLGTHDRAAAVSEFRVRGLSRTPSDSWQDAHFDPAPVQAGDTTGYRAAAGQPYGTTSAGTPRVPPRRAVPPTRPPETQAL
jgi:DNA-binding CsgD family transcriptional regulator